MEPPWKGKGYVKPKRQFNLGSQYQQPFPHAGQFGDNLD